MKRLVIIFIFLINGIISNAQVLTLDSILIAIESDNPMVLSYQEEIKSLDAFASGARAWDPPQVGTGLFMTPYNSKMWRAANGGMGSVMVQGQQMIPNPQKTKANQLYMESMSEVEKATSDNVVNELYAQAKQAYFGIVILNQKKSKIAEQEQLINYSIKAVEIRYQYGNEKVSAIYKAKASLGELQNLSEIISNEIESNRIKLNQLMNRGKSISFEVDTSSSILTYELKTIDSVELSKSKSSINAINQSINNYKYKQSFERSKLKPDFGIQYAHMFTFGGNPNLFSVMGMVTIPIAPWSSKSYKSNMKGIDFQLKSFEKQRESILNESISELETLKLKIVTQKRQLSIYSNTILPSLKKSYQFALLSYEQNTEELDTVLDNLEALLMAELDYLSKKYELLLLQIDYERNLENR